jgi:hypothetical protein
MPRLALLILLLLMAPCTAWGHPMPNSAVVLRIHRTDISVELTLPIGELAIGWDKPLPVDAEKAVREYGEKIEDYVRAHVRASAPDGRPWTVIVQEIIPVNESEPDVRVTLSMTPPPDAPVDRLTLHYDVIFHHLVTHTAVVTLASDWRTGVLGDEPILLGTMRDTNADLAIDRSGGSWSQGFAAMFRLGARHIAEGTDHLLFLLALILPAPLVAAGGRWRGYAGAKTAFRRIVKVVTAFTLGHSVTLVVGALGWVRLPNAIVESAIAVSILVSAIHALFPIFRGREVFIAGAFGLVHGLAFASTLTGFGFDPLTLMSSVLGFNLGIEAFQLLIILLVMPCLVVMARTRIYEPFRVAGAALTGIAAAAWLAERAFGWTNPISTPIETVASHALWLLAAMVVLTIVATVAEKGMSPIPGRLVTRVFWRANSGSCPSRPRSDWPIPAERLRG